MRKLLKRLLAAMVEPGEGSLIPDLSDVFAFSGLGCACYGIAQIYPPAAWIVGGAALFWLGVQKGS